MSKNNDTGGLPQEEKPWAERKMEPVQPNLNPGVVRCFDKSQLSALKNLVLSSIKWGDMHEPPGTTLSIRIQCVCAAFSVWPVLDDTEATLLS